MDEYIELTEELILSMRAGARAIANTKKYHGTIYVSDLFSENPKEMPYLKAAEILYAASEKESADVTTVRHGRWIPVTERMPDDCVDVLACLQCGDCVVAVKSGPIWRERFTNIRLEDGDITHWMPLPEPPKEVKDNE